MIAILRQFSALLVASASLLQAPCSRAEALLLSTNAQVRGEGIFLADICIAPSNSPLPHLRLMEAPGFGAVTLLTRAQVLETLQKCSPDLAAATWGGAERIRITRRVRMLGEAELREQLTSLLQRESVRDKGELELRLVRPWNPVPFPDEPYQVKILDLPSAGVTPTFILRFELITARETLGPCQLPLAARVYREIWVARSVLERAQLFADAEVARERRDILSLREPAFAVTDTNALYEIAEHVPPGAPIYVRSVRLRPVVFRGRMVDAQLSAGAMTVSMKVEVLENGVPGQLVRVRNPLSKREFRGKVQDEQTILVSL